MHFWWRIRGFRARRAGLILESFNIDAKTSGGMEITRDNISHLTEQLLVSRFQFRYHRESRETTEYALEVAKGGVRLKADPSDGKGSMSTNSKSGTVTLKATKISMQDFAGSLARQTGRPVVDQTGLAGEFDFDLTGRRIRLLMEAGRLFLPHCRGWG